MTTDTSRRKTLLINRNLQMSFLTYTLSIAVVVMGVFFAANRYFFWAFERRGKSMGLSDGHIFFKFLSEQRWTMDMIYLVTGAIVCLILAGMGLYLSNRVAGPIYHLHQHLLDFLKGQKVDKLEFREKDYFSEVAETVNQILDKYDAASTQAPTKKAQ